MDYSRRVSRMVMMALAAVATAAVQANAGDGLRPVSFSSLSQAKPRAVSADFYVDDRDRDPHGMDVFDVGFRLRFQAGGKTEIFANLIVDRVVALPEAPPIPPSPRDLIFAGAARTVPNAFAGEHPYLDKRGEARVDAFIPGTATIGLTRMMRSDGVALGLSAALAIPLSGNLNALRSGANSGRPDAIVAGLGSRDLLGGTIHGRVGFTLAGKGSWPDRSFSVSSGSVQVSETDPPIGNRLDTGLAWIRPFASSMALAIEARSTKEFTGRERIDAVSPLDLLLGVHRRFGPLSASIALLNHFRSLPSGALRANPLAGAIDLSQVSVTDRNAFLARTGLGAVAGQIRDGAHIVAIGVTTSTLPQGAVLIPASYTIRSEHNLGYVVTLTWRP